MKTPKNFTYVVLLILMYCLPTLRLVNSDNFFLGGGVKEYKVCLLNV